MSTATGPVVRTSLGRVRGTSHDDVVAFKGVPYAEPPVGERRLRAPEPARGWDGVRDAIAFGPTVPKTGYAPPYDRIFIDPVIPGDAWLSVNVWTPDPAAGGLPVLVWIHGGAFRNGTSANELYDGAAFAREGVVVVTLNYRVATEGFLFLDDTVANRGLLDQILALEWVQEHVAAFGGDPGNVTVFGESAGAMSVVSLLTAPRADGLMRRAIAMSGGGHHALSPEDARRVSAAIAGHAGVAPTRDAVAAAPRERLREAEARVSLEVATRPDPARWGALALDVMPFEPTVDGDVLPARPIDAIAAGASAEIPLLTGTAAEEWRLFTVPAGVHDALDDADVERALAAYGASGASAVYAALEGSAGDRLCAIVTDWFFRIPAIRLAETRAGGPAPTYLYELAWRSPTFGGRLGACHGLDLPFAFDTLGTDSGRALAGDEAPREVGRRLRAAFVAFAHDGDPGWPAYDPARERATMVFDERSRAVDDPAADRRRAWDARR